MIFFAQQAQYGLMCETRYAMRCPHKVIAGQVIPPLSARISDCITVNMIRQIVRLRISIKYSVTMRLIILLSLALNVTVTSVASEHDDRSINPETELVLVTGATGRVGQYVIAELKQRGYRVRGITRNKTAAIERFGNDYEWIEANMLDINSLRDAMRGVDRVISAAGATQPDGPDGPQYVDYEGNVNLINAAAMQNITQFILVSSIGVSQRFHLLNLTFGNALIYKRQAEAHLRSSGLNYSIVRPGGLRPGRGGVEGMAIEQGDKKGGSYIIIPDVAFLLAWLIDNPQADGKTFEVLSNPNAPPLEWQKDFGRLYQDTTQ